MRFAGQLIGDGMNLDDGGYSNNTTYSCSNESSVNMMRLIWDYNRFGNHPEEFLISKSSHQQIKS